MVDRTRTRSLVARAGLLVGLPWLLSAAAFPPARPAAVPGPGEHVTAAQEQEPEVVIRWVLRSKDLGTCGSAVPNLRRALFEHGSRVRIEAIAVEMDTGVVRSFMQNERFYRVAVTRFSESRFQQELAGLIPAQHANRPVLLVSVPRRTHASFASASRDPVFWANRQGSADLLARLRDLLHSPGSERSRLVTAEGGQR